MGSLRVEHASEILISVGMSKKPLNLGAKTGLEDKLFKRRSIERWAKWDMFQPSNFALD